MDFVLGILLMWLGIAGLYVAFHGTDSVTPWAIYKEVLGQGGSAAASGTDGSGATTGTAPAGGGQ